ADSGFAAPVVWCRRFAGGLPRLEYAVAHAVGDSNCAGGTSGLRHAVLYRRGSPPLDCRCPAAFALDRDRSGCDGGLRPGAILHLERTVLLVLRLSLLGHRTWSERQLFVP